MKKALVVGGNSGIGLAITVALLDKKYDYVYIVGKDAPLDSDIPVEKLSEFKKRTNFQKLNLLSENYDIFDAISDIDTLIITAGFGRVASFDELTEPEITNLIKCNMLALIRVLKKYYDRIHCGEDFYCAVMGSIAGHVASPLFSVYGATKSGLCSFIENVNAELEYEGYKNRILDVSPGSLKGTNFNGTGNDISRIRDVAETVISKMLSRETLYIPQYDDVYKGVIDRYSRDKAEFAHESYDYKIKQGRKSSSAQVVVGYLSGTFDLFHIGHLNLLRRAKEYCDYLIVGVHESGSWKGKETYIPYNERAEIVGSIKYVDKVVKSFTEDSDAYEALHYDKLFVGSDYKGSERFNRYEKYFEDKGVEIVYFPYTSGTSSTQLREMISTQLKNKK